MKAQDDLNTKKFWEWFDIKRGDANIRQIERRAGVPRSRIGNPYKRRRPTESIMLAIARGLSIPLTEVERAARQPAAAITAAKAAPAKTSHPRITTPAQAIEAIEGIEYRLEEIRKATLRLKEFCQTQARE